MKEEKETKCPICGSFEIASFRYDSDWGTGGDWSQVNNEKHYQEYQLEHFKNNERADINCFYCYTCASCFN